VSTQLQSEIKYVLFERCRKEKQHTNGDSRPNTYTLTTTIQEYYTETEKVTALYPGDKEKLP
jgi:hypothetical protein